MREELKRRGPHIICCDDFCGSTLGLFAVKMGQGPWERDLLILGHPHSHPPSPTTSLDSTYSSSFLFSVIDSHIFQSHIFFFFFFWFILSIVSICLTLTCLLKLDGLVFDWAFLFLLIQPTAQFHTLGLHPRPGPALQLNNLYKWKIL